MYIELTDTKSGKRENIILNKKVRELIKTIASERSINILNPGDNAFENVFLGKYGNPLKDFRHQMRVTFKKAGMNYRPFHTFRHFWTSQMFNAGVDVGKIQKMGRWQDMKTMMRYCHSNMSEEQEAIEIFSNFVENKKKESLALQGAVI